MYFVIVGDEGGCMKFAIRAWWICTKKYGLKRHFFVCLVVEIIIGCEWDSAKWDILCL
jgi:hypothetical protein